jgi:hypothetical protein
MASKFYDFPEEEEECMYKSSISTAASISLFYDIP